MHESVVDELLRCADGTAQDSEVTMITQHIDGCCHEVIIDGKCDECGESPVFSADDFQEVHTLVETSLSMQTSDLKKDPP